MIHQCWRVGRARGAAGVDRWMSCPVHIPTAPGQDHDSKQPRDRATFRPMVEQTTTRKRSIVKALTYRIVIVCLDFTAVYLLTKKVAVATGFMVASNLYTTIAYFLHERMWARIAWGRTRQE